MALDPKGFVVTGEGEAPSLATSRPGVLAIGDERSGSVKRVGGANGEGATAVAQIHGHLAVADATGSAGIAAMAAPLHDRA